MQRVKYFSRNHMMDIEKDINDFIENRKVKIKIVNIAITTNNNSYHALVTYEIN